MVVLSEVMQRRAAYLDPDPGGDGRNSTGMGRNGLNASVISRPCRTFLRVETSAGFLAVGAVRCELVSECISQVFA